jgi:hypothetical protein
VERRQCVVYVLLVERLLNLLCGKIYFLKLPAKLEYINLARNETELHLNSCSILVAVVVMSKPRKVCTVHIAFSESVASSTVLDIPLIRLCCFITLILYFGE